jgi:hypothetical protein
MPAGTSWFSGCEWNLALIALLLTFVVVDVVLKGWQALQTSKRADRIFSLAVNAVNLSS